MISVSFRGTNYQVPEPADTFPQSLTDYLNALSTGAVPFPSTADVDLGASGFGLKSAAFKTRAANPSSSGLLRLANGDTVAWRNAGNTADLSLAVDAQNQLTFAGNEVTGNPFLGANTGAAQSIPNAGVATIVVFGTVETDTDSSYNAGTGRYTVPAGKGGQYEIDASIAWATAATTPFVQVFKNAALLKTIASGGTGTVLAAASMEGGTCKAVLAAGDVIDIRVGHSSGGAVTLLGVANNNYFSLKRIPA